VLALAGFAVVVAPGASVERATAMALLVLGAQVGDHRTVPWQAWAAAVATMVVRDPLALAQPGLLLTCGATAALLDTGAVVRAGTGTGASRRPVDPGGGGRDSRCRGGGVSHRHLVLRPDVAGRPRVERDRAPPDDGGPARGYGRRTARCCRRRRLDLSAGVARSCIGMDGRCQHLRARSHALAEPRATAALRARRRPLLRVPCARVARSRLAPAGRGSGGRGYGGPDDRRRPHRCCRNAAEKHVRADDARRRAG
jgi:hypothetical protein